MRFTARVVPTSGDSKTIETPDSTEASTCEASSSKKKAGMWSGSLLEKALALWLERLGYKVHRAQNTASQRGPMWVSQSNDLWNVFDVAGLKIGEPNWLIQVTTRDNRSVAARKEKIEELAPWLDLTHNRVELWQGYDVQDGRRSRPQCRVERLTQVHDYKGFEWTLQRDHVMIPMDIADEAAGRKPQVPG